MNLKCRFFATFRQAVGSKTIEREVEDETTVGDLLSALETEYDGLEGQLLDGESLKPSINVLRNGREVLHMDGSATELADGDTVSVFPPVAGG
ncbi:molybdopterin synthase sulfur carrier subunit [Halobacteriales archaeon QS_8_65_32]|jgi:molybdopterin synthase sulfur carrier subunit|nr:MAG: molybdopterin synthase sulfur carrier subunit [Halobacteriales archaeon QS_8_65_32]